MNKLISELQRLYFLPDQQWHSQAPDCLAEGTLTPSIVAQGLAGEKDVALDLVGAVGRARGRVLIFERSGDWEQMANLYQALQGELDLPAPAMAVSGKKGFRLWFSLAEPMPATQATVFLKALRDKYLADIPEPYLELRPDTVESAAAGLVVTKLVPALHQETGKWSAFIDPSMGSMFVEEPGLEMAPNLDRQADMLAGLESIGGAALQRALQILLVSPENASNGNRTAGDSFEPSAPGVGGVGNSYTDPRSFLLAVMNDPTAGMGQRIKAAKALLPTLAELGPENSR